MTPEQIATVIELAIYRVGDRWRASDKPDEARVGRAIREIAEEITKLLADYRQ